MKKTIFTKTLDREKNPNFKSVEQEITVSDMYGEQQFDSGVMYIREATIEVKEGSFQRHQSDNHAWVHARFPNRPVVSEPAPSQKGPCWAQFYNSFENKISKKNLPFVLATVCSNTPEQLEQSLNHLGTIKK